MANLELYDNENILEGVESPPVLFLIFNRPMSTQKVFNAVREVKPNKIFVAADGPRKGVPTDLDTCLEARKIIEQVDWECEVKLLYREENIGCRAAISSGIDWFFSHVDEGIILEDDCLPSKSFFRFCQILLEKYRHNDSVMQINGSYYLDDLIDHKESYYFSKIISCWGWATWKSSWGSFDGAMSDYGRLKSNGLIKEYYDNKYISNWMESYLDEANAESCGIWSTQWAFKIIKKNALSITPTINLVQNIGFNNDATTGVALSFRKYSKFTPNDFQNMAHPSGVSYNKNIDALHFRTIIKKTDPRLNKTIIGYIAPTIKKILPNKIIFFLKKIQKLFYYS